jgi:hypothetical protein
MAIGEAYPQTRPDKQTPTPGDPTSQGEMMHVTSRTATLRSATVLIGLAGIVAVHAIDVTGKMQEVPYMGLMYLGVIAAAGFLMERIVRRGTRLDFLAAAGLAAAVIVGYVVNRTVGMPGAMDDIGNWWEPLGLLSLMVEGWVVWHALAAARIVTLPESDEESAVRRARRMVAN